MITFHNNVQKRHKQTITNIVFLISIVYSLVLILGEILASEYLKYISYLNNRFVTIIY